MDYGLWMFVLNYMATEIDEGKMESNIECRSRIRGVLIIPYSTAGYEPLISSYLKSAICREARWSIYTVQMFSSQVVTKVMQRNPKTENIYNRLKKNPKVRQTLATYSSRLLRCRLGIERETGRHARLPAWSPIQRGWGREGEVSTNAPFVV